MTGSFTVPSHDEMTNTELCSVSLPYGCSQVLMQRQFGLGRNVYLQYEPSSLFTEVY